MNDVPIQYKKATDDNVIKIMESATILMAISGELGGTNIQLSSDEIIVKITKKPKAEKRN